MCLMHALLEIIETTVYKILAFLFFSFNMVGASCTVQLTEDAKMLNFCHGLYEFVDGTSYSHSQNKFLSLECNYL